MSLKKNTFVQPPSVGDTPPAVVPPSIVVAPVEVPGLGFWAFWGPRAVDQLGTHLN